MSSGCLDQHGRASVAWRISDGCHLIRFPHTASGGSFMGRGGTTQDVSGPQRNTSTGTISSAHQHTADGGINSVCQWVYGRCSEIGRRHSAGAKSLQHRRGCDLTAPRAKLGCKAVFNTSLSSPNPSRFLLDKTLLM